jgi:hypothetical protein
MNKKLSRIILFITVCGFISQCPGVYPVFSANPIRLTCALLRPAASKITYNTQAYSGFLFEDLRQVEEALIAALLSRGEADLCLDKIEEYIDMIKKFAARGFSHEVFFKKTLALLNSDKPFVREFAAKAFTIAGELLTRSKKPPNAASVVLGIAGEISGVYELAHRPDTSLKNVRIGNIKAVNEVITDGDSLITIKEFDALSENTVFEFKFHLRLSKLYEQVIGFRKTRISHFKVLSLPEFSYIRNLVYFGENEGGNTMKAVLDFTERHLLSDRITISPAGSISVKFDIREFQEFIFDKNTLEYACRERRARFKGGFLDSRQAENARNILLGKIAQIPEGEHLDVIIGISNPAPEDLAWARQIAQAAQSPRAEKCIITPQAILFHSIVAQSA